MNRTQSAIAKVLALVILAAGTLIGPGTVLCLGPGNHCHLEMTAEECNAILPAPEFPPQRAPDGCPNGSRDFRLRVDSHRTDGMPAIGLAAALLPVTTEPAGTSIASKFIAPEFLIPPELNFAIILRC